MKLRWLLLLVSFAAPIAACGEKKSDDKASKADDDDDDDDKGKKKKGKGDGKGDGKGKGSGDAAASGAPTSGGAALPEPPPAPTEAPKAPMTKDAFDAFLKDKAAPLTPDAYETALLALAACKVESFGIDYRCQEQKDYNEAIAHKATDFKMQGKIALKHLRHPAPAVRYKSAFQASLEAFSFNATPEQGAPYFDAARTEKDPAVLAQFMQYIVNGAKKNADIRNFALTTVDHSEARVRDAALRVVTDREVYPQVTGAFDKIVSKAESDPDKTTRATACAGLGETDDPKAVAPIQKIIDDGATPDEVRGGCFEGLVKTWTGFPYPKNPSKDGHDLTMKYLDAPATDKMPPSRGISSLGWSRTEFKAFDKSGAEWHAKVKGFYDKAKLVKSLETLVTNKAANQSARSSAIYALRQLGEQKLLGTLVAGLKKEGGFAGKALAETAERESKQKE